MRVLYMEHLNRRGMVEREVSGISSITQESCCSQGQAQRDDFRIFTCYCSDEIEVKSML